MSLLEAFILAIVEGITEFLPVSSTGHMIIAAAFMGIDPENPFVKMFTVAIQFGAILSVIILYWKRFFQTTDFYFKLFVAFLPAAVIGFLLNDYIEKLLENVWVVATSLLIGGVILLFVDKWFSLTPTFSKGEGENPEEKVDYKKALYIGIFQCIAMIPGVSRSAATIIGGMSQKLNRKTAAEFSFFLAVPTMFAATCYSMLKYYKKFGFSGNDIPVLAFGNLVAFIVAMLAIKFFISFLTKYGFKVFGWYRIVVGLALLILLAMGYELKII